MTQIALKCQKRKRITIRPTDRPSDHPTIRPTDIAPYRVACTRLKTHDASDGIVTVLLNDKYDTSRSALEFATNWQQPHVCIFIRLEIILI